MCEYMLSIKEITKQTGITVRTLRYYDEIKLLVPAGKTEGGHRLYGEKELKKLQEIQFLKMLGFSLKEIKEMLSDKTRDWQEGLQNQLQYVIKEKEKLAEIEKTLIGLMNGITIDGDVNLSEVQKMIHLYQGSYEERNAYRDQMFCEEEKVLLDLLPNMNSRDSDSLEWVLLLGQLKQHLDKDVTAPQVQKIIQRMYEKTIETFGDNDVFFNKLWAVRKSPEKSKKMGFYPIEDEVLDFFERAWQVFESKQK